MDTCLSRHLPSIGAEGLSGPFLVNSTTHHLLITLTLHSSPLSCAAAGPDDRSCCPPYSTLGLYQLDSSHLHISSLYLHGTASLKWPFLHIELHTCFSHRPLNGYNLQYVDYRVAIVDPPLSPCPRLRRRHPHHHHQGTYTTITTAMAITLRASAHLPSPGWLWLRPWQSHHLPSAG